MALNNDDINEVLLSICIPTYNRAKALDETLKSITKQLVFTNTNKIEIVISDNCSTDETSEIVDKYKSIFPHKIIYSRNDEDIVDKNFEKVLSLANGCFLKLNNDTLVHSINSLNLILELIEKNIHDKPLLYFTNGILDKASIIRGYGLEYFIELVSYNTTWIATFGIWKIDFDKIEDFSKSSYLKLIQVDVLFEVFKFNPNFIVFNESLFSTINVKKKGGYDLVTVFLDNYGFLLKQQVALGNLSENAYEKEINYVINNVLSIWLAKAIIDNKNYSYILNDQFKRINQSFKKNRFKYFTFYKKLIKNFTIEILIKLNIYK